MSKFVVVGGAGRTGRLVTGLLTGDGHEVVVASRSGEREFDLIAPDTGVFDGAEGVVVSVALPRDAAEADAVLNTSVAQVSDIAAREDIPFVLVSQLPRSTPGLPASVLARFGQDVRVVRRPGRGRTGLAFGVCRPRH